MSFSSPWWLLALLLLPLLVGAYLWRERQRQRSAAAWANPALVPNLVDRAPGRRRHIPVALLLVALAAMIVGVARPHATVTTRREEATVLLAIDVSRSMGATDVPPTRLQAAKTAAINFADKVPDKFRIGVVAFSTRAQVALPPTTNRDFLRASLASLHTGEGTAIGDAVALAASLGRRQRADGVVPPTSVLLISDGARDGGRRPPLVAARQAKKQHVPVYTILLGTPNGVVQHKLPGGYNETLRVPPSAQTLQAIAKTSGGEFFTASNDRRLGDVYDALRSRLGHKRQSREITDGFAGGAALLLLAAGALSAVWFRRVP
ncbi:MAG: VWA domain-containing protein [Gaiellaceae bacterium]